MILSRNYQATYFSSTSFIDKIPSARQQIRKFSHIQYVSPRTSLHSIWLTSRLSREDNQINWRVALGSQQVTLEESIHVQLYGWPASKFQASQSTSDSAWSFPSNQSSLQTNDIWEGSNDVQLYFHQASKCQASYVTSGSACIWCISLQGYLPEDFCLSWSGS